MHGLAGSEDAERLDEECEWSFSKDTPNFLLWKLGGDCHIGQGIFGIFGLGWIDEIEDARQTGRLSFDSLLMVQTSDGDGDGDGMDE